MCFMCVSCVFRVCLVCVWCVLKKMVEMEARRYKKKQKEAMLCESVMPPQKMLSFAIQCELATQVPQRTLAL